MAKKRNKRLVIIPAFNEAQNIIKTVEDIKKNHESITGQFI